MKLFSKPFQFHSPIVWAAEFLLYASLSAFMLGDTWLTWPDVFIDFSRELYLPWRVSQGDVLYRDLAYYFGPVSVYTNAALFALLGRPSIHALFALNFVFWIATLLALRAILRRIASPLAATLAISSFILLFSFSRYTGVGNDNFLAPYSHEITRGFLFALLALLSLDSASRASLPELPATNGEGKERPHSTRFLLPGAFYAIVLFTKPELSFATTLAISLLFVLRAWQRRAVPLCPLLAFSLSTLFTVSVVIAPFAIACQSLSRAIYDTLLKLYLDCFNSELTSLFYYKAVLGTDTPISNILVLFGGALLAVTPFVVARLVFRGIVSRPLRISATILLSALVATIAWHAWPSLNAALPFAPLALLVLILGKRGRPEPATHNAAPEISSLAAAFALFALALVSKITLNAGIFHYGFVLALPAFCCAVLLAFHPPLPRHRAILASVAVAAFALTGIRFSHATLSSIRSTTPIYGHACRTDSLHAAVAETTLAWIEDNTSPDSTLAVLPEGAVLNVLSGRPNSTPYTSLEQQAWLRYDPQAILAAYSNNPPGILVHVYDIGTPELGIDYAQDFMAFLSSRYTPVQSLLLPSPSDPAVFLLIARKNEAPRP